MLVHFLAFDKEGIVTEMLFHAFIKTNLQYYTNKFYFVEVAVDETHDLLGVLILQIPCHQSGFHEHHAVHHHCPSSIESDLPLDFCRPLVYHTFRSFFLVYQSLQPTMPRAFRLFLVLICLLWSLNTSYISSHRQRSWLLAFWNTSY